MKQLDHDVSVLSVAMVEMENINKCQVSDNKGTIPLIVKGSIKQGTSTGGRSNSYLASLLDGPTIARDIYYHVVHFCTRLLSKSQPNRTRSFVLTAF